MNLRIAQGGHDTTPPHGRASHRGADDALLPPFMLELGDEADPKAAAEDPTAEPSVDAPVTAPSDADMTWRAWSLATPVAPGPTPVAPNPPSVADLSQRVDLAAARAKPDGAALPLRDDLATFAVPVAPRETPDARLTPLPPANETAPPIATPRAAKPEGAAPASASAAEPTPEPAAPRVADAPVDAAPFALPEAIVRVANNPPDAPASPPAASAAAPAVDFAVPLAATITTTVTASAAPAAATPERLLRDAADALTRGMSTRAHPLSRDTARTLAPSRDDVRPATSVAAAAPATTLAPVTTAADAVTVVSAPSSVAAVTVADARAPRGHAAAAGADASLLTHVPTASLVNSQGVMNHPSLGAITVSASAPIDRGAVDVRIHTAREDAAREIRAHASSLVAAVRAESPLASLRVEHVPVTDAAARPHDAHSQLASNTGHDASPRGDSSPRHERARDDHDDAPQAVAPAPRGRVRFVL